MSTVDWAGIAVAVTTLIGSLSITVRHLVKHYLSELKPNGGTSTRDAIDRLEKRIDEIFILIADK